MNIGSGKTTVGLLIVKSSINEQKRPAKCDTILTR